MGRGCYANLSNEFSGETQEVDYNISNFRYLLATKSRIVVGLWRANTQPSYTLPYTSVGKVRMLFKQDLREEPIIIDSTLSETIIMISREKTDNKGCIKLLCWTYN